MKKIMFKEQKGEEYDRQREIKCYKSRGSKLY